MFIFRRVSVFVGSDTKLMMSKVKLQFDELRDKVHFLLSVKKYLQVCVDASFLSKHI